MQRVPDFDLIPYEERMVCAECKQEVEFLVNVHEVEKFKQAKCMVCFCTVRPEYTDAVVNFFELLTFMLEEKSRFMTEEEMHELYGDEAKDE